MATSLRFRRLRLKNWKNFREVDIAIHDRMFLVGANGSGKSNLLDAFRFLRDLALPSGGLDAAVASRKGIDAIRCLAAPQDAKVAVEVEAEDREDGTRWRYALSFGQDAQRRARVHSERVSRDGCAILDRPDADDRGNVALARQTHLEQVSRSLAFQPLQELFASIRYAHLVPQVVRNRKQDAAGVSDPYGSTVLDEIADTEAVERERLLALLEKALRATVPQLEAIRLTRDRRGVPHLRTRFKHWRDADAWQAEDRLSDGTLRLIGMLWAAMTCKGPLLLEEPELSLHPAAVRMLLQALHSVLSRKETQLFVSTHSTEFLRDGGIGLAETILLSSNGDGEAPVPASSDEQLRILHGSGMSVAEVAFPSSPPPDASGLMLFAKPAATGSRREPSS